MGKPNNSCLVERFHQRRDKCLVSLMLYLQDLTSIGPSSKRDTLSHLFPTSSTKEVHKLAKELMSRLFGLEEESQQDVSSSSADSEDLEACLASSERNSKKIAEQKASYNLAEDFKYFEKTENLSPNLNLLYNALRQISPTSVPSEREFSVSGGIMT